MRVVVWTHADKKCGINGLRGILRMWRRVRDGVPVWEAYIVGDDGRMYLA